MKIVLIGPTYPLRGGISHHTTLLYRHLRKRHEVHFFAFRRQYPKWIYPGKSDKDSSQIPIKEDGIEHVLDSLNPVTWVNVFQRIRRVSPELIIFPWWVSFWAPQFWTITSLTRIFTHSKILFICHNVVEHESSVIDKICTRFVLKKGHQFIVHSNEDLRNLRKIITDANVKKNTHPSYEVFHRGDIPKEEARKQLCIEGNTILFFGFVRPYKGLHYLIEAMPKIIKHQSINLLIVGEIWQGEEEYRKQIAELGIGNNIRIINQYVPNEQVGLYFAASDLVVLPYVSATGSGIVQAAFGCNKPVISTLVGSLQEVIDHSKTGYLVPPKDSKAIADAVLSFYKNEQEINFIKNIIKVRERFSWDKMVDTIESFSEISETFKP